MTEKLFYGFGQKCDFKTLAEKWFFGKNVSTIFVGNFYVVVLTGKCGSATSAEKVICGFTKWFCGFNGKNDFVILVGIVFSILVGKCDSVTLVGKT